MTASKTTRAVARAAAAERVSPADSFPCIVCGATNYVPEEVAEHWAAPYSARSMGISCSDVHGDIVEAARDELQRLTKAACVKVRNAYTRTVRKQAAAATTEKPGRLRSYKVCTIVESTGEFQAGDGVLGLDCGTAYLVYSPTEKRITSVRADKIVTSSVCGENPPPYTVPSERHHTARFLTPPISGERVTVETTGPHADGGTYLVQSDGVLLDIRIDEDMPYYTFSKGKIGDVTQNGLHATPVHHFLDWYVDTIMVMIEEDITSGVVPLSVTCWQDLHYYVDANDYTEQAHVPWGADMITDADPNGQYIVNAVQHAVTDRLIKRITQQGRKVDAAGRTVHYDARGLAYIIDGNERWYVTQCCGSPVTYSIALGDAELCCKGCYATVDERMAGDPPADPCQCH